MKERDSLMMSGGLFSYTHVSFHIYMSLFIYTCLLSHMCLNALQHDATHCNTLRYTATHCNTLQHTATHCNTLQHTATHSIYTRLYGHTCDVSFHTCVSTHCNALQHTATHGNTRQHTATAHAGAAVPSSAAASQRFGRSDFSKVGGELSSEYTQHI